MMTARNIRCLFRSLLVLSVLAFGVVGSSWADPILESGSFSVGLGATNTDAFGAYWGTTETSGANTLPGGNIALTISVHSPPFSSAGPTFPNRVLSNQGGVGQNTSGYNKETGLPDRGATISAVYTGPVSLPPDATIRIQIDSISLYGLVHSAPFLTGATADMGFAETTAGHAATSPSQSLNSSTGIGTAANYTQLTWDPADFTQLYNSATRTFALSTDGDNPTVDGFQISGIVTVFIPEPSSAALLLVGLGLAVARRAIGR
jgi:hypothetical protein